MLTRGPLSKRGAIHSPTPVVSTGSPRQGEPGVVHSTPPLRKQEGEGLVQRPVDSGR